MKSLCIPPGIRTLVSGLVLAGLGACSSEKPAPFDRDASRAQIAQMRQQAKDKCARIQAQARQAIATRDAWDHDPRDTRAAMPWRPDAKSGETRAMLAVGTMRFAFRHDSVDDTYSAPILYYDLPDFVPLLDLYCDPDGRDKTFSAPSRLEVSLRPERPATRRKGISWAGSRELIWFDKSLSGKIAHARMGLESKVKQDQNLRTEIFIPMEGHLRKPDGDHLRIECNEVPGMVDRMLGCSTQFTYRGQVSVSLRFARAYLPEWERIVQSTIAVLDDAWREPVGEVPPVPEPDSSTRDES